MKAFIRQCLQRPVGTTAFYAFVVVLAGVALARLPVALLPDLQYPALAVWTAYPDVAPGQVERAVTEPVEEAVAGLQGLKEVTARSQMGGSLVRLGLGWNADLGRVMLAVREELARLGATLPEEAKRPVVLQLDPSNRPVMLIALRSADTLPASGATRRASMEEALIRQKRLAEEVVARRLEQLEGLARVRVTGGRERQISVRARPDQMAAYDVGLGDISQALQSANVALPGGLVRRGPFRYAVEVTSEYQSPADVAETVVKRGGQVAVQLGDVAEVRLATADRRGLVRLNGGEALLLLVERTPDANTVAVAERARKALGGLRDQLQGVRLEVVVDESQFIEAAISGVTQAVWLGGLLAVAVLFLFLRRLPAMAAVAVAVPLSLAGTFVLFDLFGVTLNLIALGGLALGVGLLVDNAIIVTENIARLREEGSGPFEAALEGTREVAGAITASTLTTIAVFLPITFVEGLAGRLFRDQSLAVVFSLLASLLVALTAVPLIAKKGRHKKRKRALRSGLLHQRYEQALSWCLSHGKTVLAGAFLFLLLGGLIGWALPREVVPEADQGRIELRLRLPPEASLALVSYRARQLEEQVERWPGVKYVLADLGQRDEARLTLDPRPPYEGTLTVVAGEGVPAGRLARRAQELDVPSDMELQVRQVPTRLEELLGGEEADLKIDLVADRRREAEEVAGAVLSALRGRRELTNVRRAAQSDVPAYRMRFNRTNMARFGVTPQEVSIYLEAAARGRQATELRRVSEEVPIVLKAGGGSSMQDLLAREVPTSGGLKPLRTFVEAERTQLPSQLIRSGQAPVVRLSADVAPESDLAAAAGAAGEVLAERLPAGVRGQVGGANEAFRRSLRAVGMSLLLSILLVYLILAAQFESLRQPLVILSAVPLAAGGVACVLWATGQSLNLMSLTGCVVLVGIVVNDAIIKVDFINQRRAAGRPLREAIQEAGRDRLRPILMTTATTVLGLLPLALGMGAGAELRAPLAIAIVGGLLSATVLTLFVVPVLYASLSS